MINKHTNQRLLHLIGYASSVGGPALTGGNGPIVLKESPYLSQLESHGLSLHWDSMITPGHSHLPKLQIIEQQCHQLANHVLRLTQDKQFFIVLGGDHSSAIGTWSGAKSALKNNPLGLIWIDAHMDSHTPQTTLTGNVHGMPLACLLGYGNPSLTTILTHSPVLDPANVCLIGVRSFEEAEAALLNRLNVRIFYMDEVKERGMTAVMQEALSIVTKNTGIFGLSLDIDSIDPRDAPATDVSEPNGIRAHSLCDALSILAEHPQFIGAEIVEFDPSRDHDHKTEKLIPELIKSFVIGTES